MTAYALSLDDQQAMEKIQPYFSKIHNNQTLPENCHIMVKPTGSVCNLDCKYCFYLEKEALYPERNENWQMTDETLEQFVQQYIEAQSAPEVTFAWQGGEPTMMGLAFFEKAVELQQQYAGGKTIINTFQTNGILLNEKWVRFFAEHNFLIGLSIDGPADLHDHYRVTRSGKPTFDKVMAAVELFKAHNVEFNTLTVVNDKNVKEPLRVYEFLKSIGSTYMQFIPLIERKAAQKTADGLTLISPDYHEKSQVTEWSVSALEYGDFLCEIFDLWLKRDVGVISVNAFDTAIRAWLGVPTGVCVFSKKCGGALAMEANGDVYACDHYVYPDKRWGNIHEQSIKSLNQSDKRIEFGNQKYDSLNNDCKNCPYLFACNGGCPKHRFAPSSSGIPNHNYFCGAYKRFFSHAEFYLKIMAKLLSEGKNITNVKKVAGFDKVLKSQFSPNKATKSRNRPCECGSGLKAKRCCEKLN